jgi:pyridoxal phosphate enzyme (YggS family)
MSKIAERLTIVQNNIAEACARIGRNPEKVQLIVVTKTASMEDIQEVVRLGCTHLGENRVQHLKQVAEDLDAYLATHKDEPGFPQKVHWHMIGHLQRNKAKLVLKVVSLIHSVDTLRLAEELNSLSAKQDLRTEVLLQINCSDEPQKSGAPVGAAVHLAEQIATMPNLRLVGLMTMAPLTLNKDLVRACFARGRELFEEIRGEKIAGNKFRHLSMGMSQDYEIAIEFGATILRIGSAIFS